MRALDWRRLDHNVLKGPVLANMGKAFFGLPGPANDIKRLKKKLLRLVGLHVKAVKLICAIAFANPKIQPSTRKQIHRGRLLSQQHRIMPGQDNHGCAQTHTLGARGQIGQQIERG